MGLEAHQTPSKGAFRVKDWIRREQQLAEAVLPNYGGPVLSTTKVHYELANRIDAINCGGIGAMHALVGRWGLAKEIDRRLGLLKLHMPYHESDQHRVQRSGRRPDTGRHRTAPQRPSVPR